MLWLYDQLIFVLGRARTEPHCVFSDIFSKRKPLVPISWPPQQSSWARLAQDRTRWKSECCLSALRAPLMSHAETSHCWFPLLTSKQTRKEMENSSPISYHRYLWCCIMLDRACTSPPSCLSAASPHRGGSCVCRDATSWQGGAVTQPLKSWRAHSPDLC